MKHLKKILSIVVAALFYLNSLVVFAEEPSASQHDPSYLYIQSAREAKIQKNLDTGNYEITLKNVDPWVIYFTERPHRDTGFMPVDVFLNILKKEGKKFEPKGLNAAIVSLDNKNQHKTVRYVFTLHTPKYKNTHTVVYQGNFVPSQDVPAATIVPPSNITLQHVVLFIDACVGCVPPP
jgi:hypothetical protein